MNAQQRPQDVRLVINGVELDVDDTDVRYAGPHDGLHMWKVYGPAGTLTPELPSLRIGVLPARTGVTVPLNRNPGGGYTFAQPQPDRR